MIKNFGNYCFNLEHESVDFFSDIFWCQSNIICHRFKQQIEKSCSVAFNSTKTRHYYVFNQLTRFK